MSMFQKATKKKAKLRLAIAGPSGAGKTFTALTLGKHIGKRIAVIDTERGSASKYAGDVADFDACELDHFAVQKYITAINGAAAEGYDVLVIDSLSHAWAGKGGILEEADKRGGKFGAWRELTPMQQRLVDTILSYPGHVIATMRSKMDYAVTIDDSKGRKETKVEKLGLAPVQRDDMSFEFDVMIDMDERHNGRVTKSRCPGLADAVISKPGKELADTLMAWLSDGEEVAPERPLAAAEQQHTTHAKPAEAKTNGASSEPDEYGLIPPPGPCPVVGPGKPNAGKRWDELPGGLLEKMYADYGDKMNAHQRAHAEYLLARRSARKAKEQREVERAAAETASAAEEAGWTVDRIEPGTNSEEAAQ